MSGPIKNSAYTFYCGLTSQADTDIFKVNPTLAAGDVTVSIDGGTANNCGTLPYTAPSGGAAVRCDLSAAEMNGDVITVKFSDQAGSEWQDLLVTLITETASLSSQAAAVWGYTTRSLTQTAAQVAEVLAGNDITLTSGISFAATLSGLTIPATWSKIYLTVKSGKKDPDAAATIQLVESNPGVGTDGLLYLNGAAGTAAQGSLTVTQAAGTIAIALTDEATAQLVSRWSGAYDVKCLLADGSSQILTYGDFTIALTETKAIT